MCDYSEINSKIIVKINYKINNIMKTKKKIGLFIAYLICLFLFQSNGLGAQNIPNKAPLDSDNPWDYFEIIEFSPMPFTLLADEYLKIQMYRKEDVELQGELWATILFQNTEDNSVPPLSINVPLNSAGYTGYWALEVFEAMINITDFANFGQIKAGYHDIQAAISDNNWEPPFMFYGIGGLEIHDFEPLTEQPVIEYVNMTPSNIYAGLPGSGMNGGLSVNFGAIFSTYEAAQKAKQAKIVLYRSDENEQRSMISETVTDLFRTIVDLVCLLMLIYGSMETLWQEVMRLKLTSTPIRLLKAIIPIPCSSLMFQNLPILNPLNGFIQNTVYIILLRLGIRIHST